VGDNSILVPGNHSIRMPGATIQATDACDAAALRDLIADAKAKQAMSESRALKPVLFSVPKAKPVPSNEDREREIARIDKERIDGKKSAAWSAFIGERGTRYAECSLENFAVGVESQRKAIETLTAYRSSIAERIREGEGLILFGPKGTGKDHLLCGLVRSVISAEKSIQWANGLDLFGDIRDGMTNGDTERSLIDKLTTPDVLYLSDPLPITGPLSPHQANVIFRILDKRYANRRPTWVSVNVTGGAELEERIGPQNADRLRDGAIAIHCNWNSNRKAKQ